MAQSLYRRLPAVHQLLESPELREAAARHGRRATVAACQEALQGLRARIERGEIRTAADLDPLCAGLPRAVARELDTPLREPYAGVVNATGVLLHTNLGRAPLTWPPPEELRGYLALEYELASGRRGQRLDPIRRLLASVFGAGSAVMVNNNAGAVLLMLAAHAAGREVIVSRGQLIEIVGSFRIPDVMAASGARLVEVGCTNRTHLRDYEAALGEDTAAILVAHRSNFRMEGFTAEPSVEELAGLAHAHGLPLFVDQGSGALHDLARWGLPHEPTVGEILAAGADVVCCSGDKLLGGPQAGILVGSPRWVDPLARHPLFRALRPDKTALLWMERVLAAHREERLEEIPLYRMLATPADALKRRARRLARRLRSAGIDARWEATTATLGGGTTPGAGIPSFGVVLPGGERLAAALRCVRPPVVARVAAGEVVCDLRTVPPAEDRALAAAVVAAQGSMAQDQSQDGP